MRTNCSEMMRNDEVVQAAEAVCVAEAPQDEQGFMLVGLVVAVFLILLALSVAAPKVADELKREREVEAVHRGNQFVRAVQLYYRKTGTYPSTLEQLEKTNNIRFLRQRYVDPMTGKPDWRLIHVGEAKTTVKGFFGKALTGMAPGLGAAAGMASAGPIGAGAAGSAGSSTGGSTFGSSSSGSSSFGSSSSSSGSSSFGSSSGGSSSFGSSSSSFGSSSSSFGSSSSGSSFGSSSSGSSSPAGSSPGTGSSGSSSGGVGSQSATSFSGSAAPFVGVGIPKDGTSIIDVNEQTSYNTWEFIYDPRIEQLKAAAALQGGGISGGSAASSFGSSPGSNGSSPSSGFGSSTGSSFGSSSGSGFGSSSGSSFGSSSGSGFGSNSPGSSSPSTPTTPTPPPQ